MRKKPVILIVDDISENLDFLEILIRPLNAGVIRALSGHEALLLAKGVELALALIDVRMPEMNGFELSRRLNAQRPGKKIPVILLTASHLSDSQISDGYEAGAVDYLLKPLKNYILKSKVQVFLDLFNQKQTIVEGNIKLKKASEKLVKTNIALQQSEELYRHYIENAPDGVFVADKSGKYGDVNEAACQITGYSKE